MKNSKLISRRQFVEYAAGGTLLAFGAGVSTGQAHPPTLSIASSGGNVVITYSGGTLVQASSLSGPWQAVGGSSPAVVPATSPSQFFRLQL
jgi:hypothetical protein